MAHQGGCHCGAVRYEVERESRSMWRCAIAAIAANRPAHRWLHGRRFTEDQFRLVAGRADDLQLVGNRAAQISVPKCGTGL
jgi:hypothetical protein